MANQPVLIVGAGPTGLVLALWLTKMGVGVRLVDKAATSGTTSRALVFHARNLEFYHQMGIDRDALDRGIEFTTANLWFRGKRVGRVPFGDLGRDISPYPFSLIFPQDTHEQMLVEQLESLGVHVERNTELISYNCTSDGISALLRNASGEEEQCEAKYLAGCDGAHSVVRTALGVGFPGGTYSDTFYVADIVAAGPTVDKEMHAALDDADFLIMFPMKGEGRVRLVGWVRPGEKENPNLRWEDMSQEIVKRLNLNVKEVRWFSTYRVHHRVASHFRKDRVFLLGDAAHIHSPVGGQGMNTGIGDAVNLAWKLGAVLKGRGAARLLDTYEPERIAFARKLVASTDRAFTFVTARGAIARRVRTRVVPFVLPLLFRLAAMRRLMYRTISQIVISYRRSPLSGFRGGDRLPWVKFKDGIENFGSLTTMDWQAHVYGEAAAAVRGLCERKRLALHVFPWSAEPGKAGLQKNAVYIVRPDGYIGMVEQNGDAAKIAGYLDSWEVYSG